MHNDMRGGGNEPTKQIEKPYDRLTYICELALGNSSELKDQLSSLELQVKTLQTTCSSLSDTVDTLMREVKDLSTQVWKWMY